MFACTLNKSLIQTELALPLEGFTVSYYDSIAEIKTEWNAQAGDNLFLKSGFLYALENAPPSGTSYKYGIINYKGDAKGIVYFQIKRINLYLSLRLDTVKPAGLGNRVWHSLKSFLAKRLNANILVNGNMTLTGENGFSFDKSIDERKRFEIVDAASKELVCALKRSGTRVRGLLLKDYYTASKPKDTSWSFTEFQVQPNMVMDIKPEWSSFDDYLSDMKSKYRVRVRRARKKSENLERRQLSLEEIHAHADDISRLYRNVADQAGFNLFILPKNYFYSLQKHLGDRMSLFAYFEEGKMVGYYTHISNHGELDAHFLGYDPACNKNCQLYLNMLYDLVNAAIDQNANKLIMSRTAMEIKSSVGAEAQDMHLYFRVTNSLFNRGVAKGLSYFTPDSNWKPRSPFK